MRLIQKRPDVVVFLLYVVLWGLFGVTLFNLTLPAPFFWVMTGVWVVISVLLFLWGQYQQGPQFNERFIAFSAGERQFLADYLAEDSVVSLAQPSSLLKSFEPAWLTYLYSKLTLSPFAYTLCHEECNARRWLQQRVQQSDCRGEEYYYYARACLAGMGGNQDIDQAYEYARRSIHAGCGAGYDILGVIHSTVHDKHYDLDKAFKAFQQGYEHDNTLSTLALAYCYEQGFGTLQNIDRAKICYQHAIHHGGGVVAMVKLARLYCSQATPAAAEQAYFWSQVTKAYEASNRQFKSVMIKPIDAFCDHITQQVDAVRLQGMARQARHLGAHLYYVNYIEPTLGDLQNNAHLVAIPMVTD